jgi:cytoplasmic iron level regulating protein YaaA (DUF328/UPF0246 family)
VANICQTILHHKPQQHSQNHTNLISKITGVKDAHSKYQIYRPEMQYPMYHTTAGTPAETGKRNLLQFVTSAFCRAVNEIFTLLG